MSNLDFYIYIAYFSFLAKHDLVLLNNNFQKTFDIVTICLTRLRNPTQGTEDTEIARAFHTFYINIHSLPDLNVLWRPAMKNYALEFIFKVY